MKQILVFFLLYISLIGQTIEEGKKLTLTIDDINIGTVVTSETPLVDSLEATVNVRHCYIDSITNGTLTTVTADTEILPDSLLYAQSVEPFIITGEQDSLLTTNADSSYRYNSIPTELNPNPNFDFSYTDLLSGWDFTSGWMTSSATINSATSFSSTATSGYIYKESLITALHNYQLIISGTATGTVNLYDGSGGGIQMRQYTSGSFNDTIIFTASATPTHADRILLLCSQSGTNVTITQLELVELIPPTGWTASTMDANNYVIEDDNGCKFVEVTGTTYIELTGLTNGQTYTISGDIAEFTSGELNAYNGSSETALGSSVTSFNTNITMASTTLRLQVDNNSNLVLGSLSIKEYHPTNNIQLPVSTESLKFYDAKIEYQKDSLDASPIFSWNNTDYTLNAVTSTWQDTTLRLQGTGTDTLQFAFDDTCKANVKFSIKEIFDNRQVNAGQTVKIPISEDISTVGSVDDTLLVYHSASGTNPLPVRIYGTVVYPSVMLAENDSLVFDSSSVAITDSILLTNQSPNDFLITKLVNTNISEFEMLLNGQAFVYAGTSRYLVFRFTPQADSLYSDALGVEYYTDDNFTTKDTLALTLVGKGISGSTPGTLETPVLAVIDDVGEVTIDWDAITNADGYYVYRNSELIARTTATVFSDTINPMYEENYYVVAYNNTTTSSNSNTVLTTMTPNGSHLTDYWFVASSGGDISSINAYNSSSLIQDGAEVYFNVADSLFDEMLVSKPNITLGSYGGRGKAIIGSPNTDRGNTYTIHVIDEGVTIKDLKIYGYLTADYIITYQANYMTVKNCEIIGSDDAHISTTGTQRGIWQHSSYNNAGVGHKIIGNEIHDVVTAIRIRNPHDFEIAYNTMYDLWETDGQANSGGSAIGFNSTTNSGVKWDAEQTFRIHHNNIYNFEYTAFSAMVSNTIIEYNEIHHSLDERIYRGGIKHGSVGKLYDNSGTGSSEGCVGVVFRYNYVHDLVRDADVTKRYAPQSDSDVINGTFNLSTTNGGLSSGSYAEFENGYNGNLWSSQADATYSGLGYGNAYVHNNLFVNISNQVMSRGYTVVDGVNGASALSYRDDLPTYFVNNTILRSGYHDQAKYNGFFQISDKAQSPTYIANNIFDYVHSSPYGVIRIDEAEAYGGYSNGNVFLNNGGTIGGTSASDKAIWKVYGGDYSYDRSFDKDNTQPNWQDTSSTMITYRIGADTLNGLSIPDVRPLQGGNLYQGYNLTNLNNGVDATGRAFNIGIGGDVRTDSIVGAFGSDLESDITIPVKPIANIIQQPTNKSSFVGGSVSFTCIGTTSNTGQLAYQWWREPYISEAVSRVVDGGRISGATSSTLTIDTLSLADDGTQYVCEVYNTSDHAGSYKNSNTVTLSINGSEPSADIDTLVIASGSYDAYKKDVYSTLYLTQDNVGLGYSSGQTYLAGFTFTGMNDWTTITSVTMYVKPHYDILNSLQLEALIENTLSPGVFTDGTDFLSRYGNVLDVNNTISVTSQWYIANWYGLDLTAIFQEANNTFTYGVADTGKVTVFLENKGTSLRPIESYESGDPVYIIIEGTK